jgi:hypothetical protein
MIEEWERKQMSRVRRARTLEAMWDGHDYRTKIVPSDKLYKRTLKHRPQNPYDWEELED